MDQERFDRLRLIRTHRVGPVSYRQLLHRFGTAGDALKALPDLARRGGGKAIAPPPISQIEAEVRAATAMGARFVMLSDAEYPAALAVIENGPVLLCVRGQKLDLWQRTCIAMVGARNASAAAMKLGRIVAQELAEAGYPVVSGLARGIDTAAHQGALAGGTIAVIAGGIDNIYPPENAALQDKIAEQGLLVSEMPFGTEPRARHFPHRNRIIAGLALGTLVVEAAPKSGSLITARLAGEAGREVMALPGSPLDSRSQGCNMLIREGATLVQSAQDIIEAVTPMIELDFASARFSEDALSYIQQAPIDAPADLTQASAAEVSALDRLLSGNFITVDELIRQSGLSAQNLQMQLLELELAGRLERGAGAKVRLSG